MKKLLLTAGIALLVCAAYAQASASGIVIEKGAIQANPTVRFEGGAEDEALNKKILSDLTKCGWFTVVNSGESVYRVKAGGTANALTITLSNGAGTPIMSKKIAGAADVSTAAHTAVDLILQNEFNIPGICRSKLALSFAVTNRNKDIYICDFDGGNFTRVTEENGICLEPQWAPDSGSIIYSYIGPTSTVLKQRRLNATGSAKENTRILTQYTGLNAGGAVSPDGKNIALVLARSNQIDLYVRPLEGGTLKRLTNDKAVESSPCWSPDGKTLCFVSDKSGRPVLYLVDVATGSVNMISGLSGSERVSPDFASDGTLAYSAKVGSSYTLAIAKLNGNKATMQKIGNGNTTFTGENPSWAPDNRHVILSDKNAVYIVDTRLGTKRVPFTSQTQMIQPSWSKISK